MSTITEVSRTRSVHTLRSGGAGSDAGSGGGAVSYIGFSNFPNQVFRRCIKDGFTFTLMAVGQTGLGKSTFLNTLFMADLHDLGGRENGEKSPAASAEFLPSTVRIEQKTVRLVENDVRLELTVVDTPGFGDQVNNKECWEPIIKYIDDRFADYLTEETKIDRLPNIPDKMVHLCLYFIAPTGHCLKQLDIAFLRALQDRVNIVPVIAKADTMTPAELERFKRNIMQDLRRLNIHLYEFPEIEAEKAQLEKPHAENGTTREDKENIKQNGAATQLLSQPANEFFAKQQLAKRPLRDRLPFAVVGSTHLKEMVTGVGVAERKHRIRVREYPWGTVEVDNLAHNDFLTLRDMIIRNHLIDLKDITRNVHYENYRMRNLPKNSFDGDDPFTRLEQEMRRREKDMADDHALRERVLKERVSGQEQRLLERAQAMDSEELENRKVLEEKNALLEKLKLEVGDLKRGGNLSASSLDSGSVPRSNGSGSSPEKPEQQQRMKKLGRLFGAGGSGGGGRNNGVNSHL